MQELLQAFISYKRENQDFAESLYGHLADWGFLPWLDVKKLDAGYQPELRSGGWSQQITQAINGSKLMIALITPLSLKSEIVQDEWFAAKQKKTPMFFLRLEPFDIDDMDISYRRYQYIDLVENRDEGIETLKQALLNLRTGRRDLQEEVTDTSRQSRSLNQEILSDLAALSNDAPSLRVHVPLHESPVLLRVLALLCFLISLIWLVIDIGFEPLLVFLGGIVPLSMSFKQGNNEPMIGSDKPKDFEKDWQILRDRIRRYWLESILKPSLQEAAAFNIALSLQADAVIEHEDLGNFELGGSIDIYNTYKALKSFLIMGEAGSGKTVMLLQLATKLLRHERNDIPLVLNLSSWGNEAISLEDWLMKEAERTYQIRAASFKRWLADKKLILLLDGLDEIKEEVRAERIQRINSFRKANPNIPMVICSRVAEYRLTTGDKAEKKLDFPHALRLEALSKEQIEAYLSQPEFSSIKPLYESDIVVQDLAQIPFLLTTMAYTYKEEHIRQLEIKEQNNRYIRLKHLFDKYITKQLKSHAPLKYSEEKVKEYLEWIAVKTSAYGTIFRPEEITIEWFYDDERIYKFFSGEKLYAPTWYESLFIQLRYWRNLLMKPIGMSYFISKKLPSNLEQFTKQMTERQIMRPMGGGHLFRHDYLRQNLLGESNLIYAQIKIVVRDLEGLQRIETLKRFGDPLELLIRALQDKDNGVRRQVVEVIRELRDNRAVESLIVALHDDDEYLCRVVIAALGELGDSRAVEPLIELLKNENVFICSSAEQALGDIGDSRAVEPLIELLKNENVFIRNAAVKALGDIGDSRAVEPLIEALKDSSLCEIAVITLGKLRDSRAVGPLIELLKNQNEYLRSSTAGALGEIKDSRAVEPLIKVLNDHDEKVRSAAAGALGEIKDSRAVEPLIELLKDESELVRGSTAFALGQLGNIQVVELLIKMLEENDKYVRSSVAKALGELKDSRAIEPLISLLDDTNQSYFLDRPVRNFAAAALRKIGSPEALEALRQAGFKVNR
jgi:HEAT repeat protein